MIFSMTGYAATSIETERGVLSIELRTVNHRYLEVQFRIDDIFRPLEPNLRELFAKYLNRGKVECRANYAKREAVELPLTINLPLLQQLTELNATVKNHFPESQNLSVADVMRWPGVIVVADNGQENLSEQILGLVEAVLQELNASRQREGEKLKALLMERAAQLQSLIQHIAPKLPALIEAHQQKLAARLREATVNCEDDRVRQELVLFAQKIDVDEEISRLQAHLQELNRVLQVGGAAGKRLDFLMQELNREANTLASKSVSAEVSQAAMEMKVLIEQMREQVQNIE